MFGRTHHLQILFLRLLVEEARNQMLQHPLSDVAL